MHRLNTKPRVNRQGGFVSIAAVVFVILCVFFILTQTLGMLGNKSSDSVQYLHGMKALYNAESGLERALGSISNAIAADDSQLNAACASARLDNSGSTNPIPFAGGSFQYDSNITPTPPVGTCGIRVIGKFGQAQRTVQSLVNVSSEIGTAGFGHSIMMRLQNSANVPGVAVFNLAWRRHGSTGYSTSGGQVDANACTLPSCGLQWNIESSSGTPSVGTLGTAAGIGASSGVDVVQTLSLDSNYAEVGMIMPGLVAQPVIKGQFADNKRTANTSNQTVTTGDTSSGEAKGWCNASDTLVFGVSGRGNDNVTGAFSSVVFNSAGSPAQPIPLTWIAHFPNTDGTTPGVFGDVFSEIWYTYNPYVLLTGATSSGTTITVPTAVTLKAGTILKVYSGAGALAGSTKVAADVTNQTQFQVTAAPTTALNNATLCGGICALFNNPASASSSTTFALTRATNAAQQWAGGFVCLSGVDPTKVRRIARSSARISQWNEIASD
ncbi:hypothetical protein [Limnohabitans sp.]|uniref:hypothetical protein n=1 Tax=Limnohabitans sp. TaxID=1907725 RepID=UPI00286F7141|nr:hypothetical protein [Limnohabitans sp.]